MDISKRLPFEDDMFGADCCGALPQAHQPSGFCCLFVKVVQCLHVHWLLFASAPPILQPNLCLQLCRHYQTQEEAIKEFWSRTWAGTKRPQGLASAVRLSRMQTEC